MDLAMTSRQRFFAALNGEETDCLPVLCVNQYATYEQMEKLGVGWPEAHANAEKMAALAAGGFSLLGFDAVRVPYCQTIEAEALGAEVKDGGKTDLPSLSKHPYTIGDVPQLPADFLSRGRVPELIKAVRLLKEDLGEKVVVMGGVIGPFSIASFILGTTSMLISSFKKPETVRPYVEMATEVAIMLAKALVEAGADVIVIEDMMASMDMTGPKVLRDLAFPYQKRVIESITVPTIVHICGKLDAVMVDIAQTGAAAISVEHSVNIAEAREKFQEARLKTAIIGAVDPVKTLFMGKPDGVRSEVQKFSENGVSMIAPGCAVPPATPLVNLLTMVEAARSIKFAGATIE